jgi:twitching motility protein PilI
VQIPSSLTLSKNTLGQRLGESFLKLHLAPKVLAMLPARVVKEAIVLPSQRVTAMPNMHPCLLGLVNRRGRVFWVANLMQLLGVPMSDRSQRQYSLVIVQVGAVPLALQVEAIEGIVNLPSDAVQAPPPHVNATILPYLRGCVLQPDETILVLDAEAILQSSALQHT